LVGDQQMNSNLMQDGDIHQNDSEGDKIKLVKIVGCGEMKLV